MEPILIMVVSGKTEQPGKTYRLQGPLPRGVGMEALGAHTCTASRVQRDLAGRFFQNNVDGSTENHDLGGCHEVWR